MEKRIYFATVNDNLVDNHDIVKSALIVDGKHIEFNDFENIREYAECCSGIKSEIKNPSVKFLISKGFKVQAIRLYYDKHPGVGIKKSKEIVDKMEDEMKKSAKDCH